MARRRIVFMGSPDFAIPALDRLAASHEILAVYTQPPRRSGRGMRETPQPLAAHAAGMGIEVRHPVTLKEPAETDKLAALDADLFVVVAYGLLLPPDVLALPRFGCICAGGGGVGIWSIVPIGSCLSNCAYEMRCRQGF